TSVAPWSGKNAHFGGTDGGGTVTLAADVSFEKLFFTKDGYVITGAHSLTATGAAEIDVDSGVSTGIESVIAGTLGLNKVGAGTLKLTAANTYTGGTVVKAGTLELNGPTARINHAADNFTVADAGSATLLVSDGAKISSASGLVADAAGSMGT